MPEKEKKSRVKRKTKPTVKQKILTPKYVHIDQFISKHSLDPSSAIGFRAFMRGRTYLHSYEDFEKAYQEFLNRKI